MINLTTQTAALVGLYGLEQRQLLTAKVTHQAEPYGQPTKETVSEPKPRDQAAWIEADLQTTLERHILRDGPRLLAVLAPYCMPGDDPVEVLKEAIRQAGWDQCEDGRLVDLAEDGLLIEIGNGGGYVLSEAWKEVTK